MQEPIKTILEEAGWYEGRKIEIDCMVEEYRKERLTLPNQTIEKLLTEYWNINLEFLSPNNQYGNIRLNIEDALGVSSEVLKFFESLINEELVPVGTINESSAILFASYSGKFYMAAEGIFYKIGDTFFDALETIILQRDVFKLSWGE